MTSARPRSPRLPSPLRFALGLALAALAQACLSQEPSREVPPPAVPESQAPTTPEAEETSTPAPPAEKEAAPSRAESAEPSAAPPAQAAPKSAADAEARSPSKPSAPRARAARPGASGSGLEAPDTLMQRLDREVSLSTPDCPSARDRKKSICDLATQICRLVERDPNAASTERYCDEARQRCSDAEERTSLRCTD